MNPHRISVKLYLRDEDIPNLDLHALIPVFHGWVQRQAADILLIDVADYIHVPNGPGVMLIGHEGDFGLDMTGGRPGLLYVGKRGWDSEGLESRLGNVLRMVLWGCRQIEMEDSLPLAFRTDQLRVMVPDRLEAPNSRATYEAARGPIEAAIRGVYGDIEMRPDHVSSEPRQALTVDVDAQGAPDVATLLQKAEAEASV